MTDYMSVPSPMTTSAEYPSPDTATTTSTSTTAPIGEDRIDNSGDSTTINTANIANTTASTTANTTANTTVSTTTTTVGTTGGIAWSGSLV
jgi:hypothetical protein